MVGIRPLLTEVQVKINQDELMAAIEESHSGLSNPGFCLECGEQQEGCEPDARGYECECCGARKVYGAEEILMMGAYK